jgi:hypothetical protein
MTPWSPEEIAKARQLWDNKYTTAEIGAKLGRTKNQVCGLARRQNFPMRPNPGGWNASEGPRTKRAKELPRHREHLYWVAPPPPLSARAYPAPEPHSTPPVHWRPVVRAPLPIPRGAIGPARTCQWTDCHRAPWLFCDAPSMAGYSYCTDHKAVVFRVAD